MTTAFWVCGYWLTGRLNSERRPSTRISRLITDGQHRPADEEVGEFHGRSSLFLRRRVRAVGGLHACCRSSTGVPFFSLSWPLVTTCSPPSMPLQDRHLVAARRAGGDEHLL